MKLGAVLLSISFCLLCGPAQAGKIVVNHDEWTLSNTGFGSAGSANTGAFATNVAAFFTGGASGSFLAYSRNFGLTGTSLAGAITGAGHAWTVDDTGPFDVATLSTYDGVFVGGYVGGSAVYPSNGVLIDYVNGGGNVYLMSGTGDGGSAAEAAAWNDFLAAFGFEFETSYNGVSGNDAITSVHPIFAGVDQLYQNNGSTILDQSPADARGVVLEGGLYAVFDSAAVPEPATSALLAVALAGLALVRRARTQPSP